MQYDLPKIHATSNKDTVTKKASRNNKSVEVERGLLRNNDFTFSLIKNEYIYTNLKHKNRKQSTQNTKIRNNPKIRGLQQKWDITSN